MRVHRSRAARATPRSSMPITEIRIADSSSIRATAPVATEFAARATDPERPACTRVRRTCRNTTTRSTGWPLRYGTEARERRCLPGAIFRSRICRPWRKSCAAFIKRNPNRPCLRMSSIWDLASMRLTALNVTERTGQGTARLRASFPLRRRISARSARAWPPASALCEMEWKGRRWLPGPVNYPKPSCPLPPTLCGDSSREATDHDGRCRCR